MGKKKKIQPEVQTKELADAQYEFMLRNPKQKEKLDNTVHTICSYLEVSEDIARKLIKADLYRWYRAARDGQHLLLLSYRNFVDKLKKDEEPWEPNVFLRQRNILRQIDEFPDVIYEKEWMNQIIHDSATIIRELLLSSPARRRLIVINLERTKEAIMTELEEVVTKALKEYQVIFGKEPFEVENILATLYDPFFKRSNWSRVEKKDPYTANHSVTNTFNDDEVKKDERLKWLSIWRELLEVWDLYSAAGQQPWQKTFRFIAKKVGRPLSTVKDQWYLAYEKIFGKKYIPDIKYATEQSRKEADKLCTRCPHIIMKRGKPHHAKCQKGDDFIPCSEYLAIAGKERSVLLTEYNDNLRYDDLLTEYNDNLRYDDLWEDSDE